MDEQIERMVVSVRADTQTFARDVAAMRGELEGPLASGVGQAGRLIESSLSRALLLRAHVIADVYRMRAPRYTGGVIE